MQAIQNKKGLALFVPIYGLWICSHFIPMHSPATLGRGIDITIKGQRSRFCVVNVETVVRGNGGGKVLLD